VARSIINGKNHLEWQPIGVERVGAGQADAHLERGGCRHVLEEVSPERPPSYWTDFFLQEQIKDIIIIINHRSCPHAAVPCKVSLSARLLVPALVFTTSRASSGQVPLCLTSAVQTSVTAQSLSTPSNVTDHTLVT
jgi:hypothetical protein